MYSDTMRNGIGEIWVNQNSSCWVGGVPDFARFSIYSITSTLSRFEPGRWLRGDAKAIVDGVGVRCIVSQRVSDSRMDDTRDMVIEIEDTSHESTLIGNGCAIPAPRNKNQKNNDSKSNDAANSEVPLQNCAVIGAGGVPRDCKGLHRCEKKKTFECPKSSSVERNPGLANRELLLHMNVVKVRMLYAIVAFIKQEALEKAREIRVKADEEFAIEK
ncbi:hypothetical protein BDR05DRAFT_954082, partial [Suillus weaverae]